MFPNKILIICFNDSLLFDLEKFLNENGYEVRIATSYEQIIRIDKQFNPKIVIIDYESEDTNGFQLLLNLRRVGSKSNVIIMSSQIDLSHFSILKQNLMYNS